MVKEMISREKVAKTGIKSVILGYQSIIDTITDKLNDKDGELRERVASEFPNVIKPLLKKKYFALYEDDAIDEVHIFKNKDARDTFLEADIRVNGTPQGKDAYKIRTITLDEFFEMSSKSWKDPMNYSVYGHGGGISLSLIDDKKTTNGGI